MVSLSVIVICTAAAAVAGFIDAVAGGGGLITLPALLLTGVPPHMALACNKFSACLGTATALGNFARSHLVLWRLALAGLPFSLLGSFWGTRLALQMDSSVLGKVLVLILPFAMAVTLLPKKESALPPRPQEGVRFWILISLVALLLGLYDGFSGPGTGSFLILAYHWALRVNLIESSATAKVANLASNASSTLTFLWAGAMYWPLALPMAAGSMAGNWLGSRLAIRVGARAVRRFLTVSLTLLLLTLIWQYFLLPRG